MNEAQPATVTDSPPAGGHEAVAANGRASPVVRQRRLILYALTGPLPPFFVFSAGVTAVLALLAVYLQPSPIPPLLAAWLAGMTVWAPIAAIAYVVHRRALSMGSPVASAVVLGGGLTMAAGWGAMLGWSGLSAQGLHAVAIVACAVAGGFLNVIALAPRRLAWLVAWVLFMASGFAAWWHLAGTVPVESAISEGAVGVAMAVLAAGFQGLVRDLTRMQAVEWGLRTELMDAAGRVRAAEEARDESSERQRELETELRSVREAVDAANRAKTEFLATMSHEIRTPLNGILPILEILKDSRLDPEQKQLVKTAVTSSRHLLRIINDILDYAKVESGKLELESVEFNLRELVHSITDLMARTAEQRGLKLVVDIADDLPANLRGDPIRLRQILTNLLSNAIKFTERGGITVEVTKRRSSRREVELLFSVTDTGIGIPAETVRRLFQSFTQADASTTRKHGGTGLGLAICKRLVEMMGGRIGVRSKEGYGSTFMFVVPLRKSVSDVPSARTDLEGVRALVFCKDEEHEKRLIGALSGWGVNFQRAGNMVDTLNKLTSSASLGETWAYEVLVIDSAGMDQMALALLREIRGNPDLASLRIVALTGSKRLVDEVKETSGAAVLEPPFNAGALRQTLNRLLDVQTQGGLAPASVAAPSAYVTDDDTQDLTAAGPPPAPAGHAPPPNPAPVPEAAGPVPEPALEARVLLVEDNPVNLAVARKLLARIGIQCDSAKDGRVAVDAVERNAYDVVLMDCQMPEMDGYEATREIRAREALSGRPRLPIVAMTANAMAGDREKCIEAGMDDYLAKPLDVRQLRDALERWLAFRRRQSADKELGPPEREGTAAAVVGGGRQRGQTMLDMQVVGELRDIMEEEFPAIIRGYIEHAPTLMRELDDGVAAADAGRLVRPAHSLKSSSANVGAKHLADLSQSVEHAAREGDFATAASGVAALRSEMGQVLRELQAVLSAQA
jgi:signal transduction histidine kinase/CheY-like chemotaxis protein/HPt (histidine-containing phosphotransfer) domain-containing protein